MRKAAVLLVVLAIPLSLDAADLIQNGSFETNGGANSNVLPGWQIVDEEGGNGTWLAQTGATGPVTPAFNCGTADVQPPPDGAFAAMSTQSSEGSHVLYQDVTIPAGSSPVLTFQYFIRNADGFFSPDSLSFHTNPNQQFRADIIDPASNLFTLDVLQNVLVVGEGNPRTSGYDTQTATISGLGGRTVRLRFIEVDNQACFNVGIDNVRLETAPATTPPPAIVRFTSDPETIPFAGSATLNWTTQNATSVTIDNDIGSVPLSGSRSVSEKAFAQFTMVATGAGGTTQRTAQIFVRDPGPSVQFGADPGFIEPGQPATLTWTTQDATDVSIDNGVGPVGAAGSLTVTPAKTTEYTLTATGGGVTNTSRATVFVDPGDVPIVSVTSYTDGIVQVSGSGPGADRYALTNLGRVATTITLTQNGDFFTQSPASFPLPAGATQIVTIATTAQVPGKYEGLSIPAGAGVPDGLTIPVTLFVAVAPTGTVAPTTAVARTEVAAPAGENPSGSVTFTNEGTGTLQGIATSDEAWLIPQREPVIIGPGETRAVAFATNRALRPDAASLSGAATATLSVVYLDNSPSASRLPIVHGGGTTRAVSVTIVDIVKSATKPGTPPPLAPGELAFFLPGLFQRGATAGDLVVSVTGNSVSDLKLYLAPTAGGTALVGSLDQLAPNAGITLPSVLQNLFATSASGASVQARSGNLSRVSVAALQTNTSDPAGSFITALPTFRSDRSAGPGEIVYLPGVEKTAARSTSVFVQEVSGLAATVRIDFLDASGQVAGTRNSESIDAFDLLSLPDAVPASAISVRIANTSATAARIVAYALVTDAKSQDSWTIVDSRSQEQVVAVVPSAAGSTTNTMYVLNPGDAPLEIAIDNRFNPGRRRAIGSTSGSGSAARVTVAAKQTATIPVRATNGFLRLSASGPFAVSARSASSVAGRDGVFGTALPVFATASALTAGQSQRIGGIDDASDATIAAATPVTYRSNLGLIESSGQPAVVKLTLRYTFAAGVKTSASGLSTLTVTVPGNRLLLFDGIARAIVGKSRDGFGDLRNMQLDVEVVSGSGRISSFLQTIDNGTGDSAIRTE